MYPTNFLDLSEILFNQISTISVFLWIPFGTAHLGYLIIVQSLNFLLEQKKFEVAEGCVG